MFMKRICIFAVLGFVFLWTAAAHAADTFPADNDDDNPELELVEQATGVKHRDYYTDWVRKGIHGLSFIAYAYDEHKKYRDLGIGVFALGGVTAIVGAALLGTAFANPGHCSAEFPGEELFSGSVLLPVGTIIWITGAAIWGVKHKRLAALKPHLPDRASVSIKGVEFDGLASFYDPESGSQGMLLRFNW